MYVPLTRDTSLCSRCNTTWVALVTAGPSVEAQAPTALCAVIMFGAGSDPGPVRPDGAACWVLLVGCDCGYGAFDATLLSALMMQFR